MSTMKQRKDTKSNPSQGSKAPKAPHQQLEITLSFDNGLKLKKEIAIDILELKE